MATSDNSLKGKKARRNIHRFQDFDNCCTSHCRSWDWCLKLVNSQHVVAVYYCEKQSAFMYLFWFVSSVPEIYYRLKTSTREGKTQPVLTYTGNKIQALTSLGITVMFESRAASHPSSQKDSDNAQQSYRHPTFACRWRQRQQHQWIPSSGDQQQGDWVTITVEVVEEREQ